MSHHPERTARNVRPVNQPPSFDNVIVVNKGNKFNLNTISGKRNFYVAISRACRKLHIIDVG